jgi:hypothetical protein
MEFFAEKVQRRLMEYGIKFRPPKPASSHLNGKVERLQKTDLEELYPTVDLNAGNLEDLLAEWQQYYNWERPHSSLGGKSPDEQRLLAGNKPVKALLNTVSIHGSLITAEQVPRESALVKAGKTMAGRLARLCCVFAGSEEYVFQNAVVVRVEQKTDRLYRYSLRFVEPVVLVWQKRIELYRQYLAGGVEAAYV